MPSSRREFLRGVSASGLAAAAAPLLAQDPGERPSRAGDVTVLNPRTRVPVSIIIDDSTCLANLNRFAIPQFAAATNYTRYHHDWRSMPHEIPDEFVRRFGRWAAENGVKGKYSIVPYPACMGRLDRELPGWTSLDLKASIDLVRSVMVPNWDIHPEMITHTRIIDLKTGHPYPERGLRYMENWDWTENRSADEIAAYMAYALRILKNIDLPCEGVTTPGGFGRQVPPALARGTLEACRDVYGAEIPHYFRWLYTDERSVAPRVELASGLDGPDPRCVVSIIGCTGDWTGGWDCSREPEPDRFITEDLATGRLVDVIERGEPACLVCHWTGVYFNGLELGFRAFQEVVRRLHSRYDNLAWMTLSEISRYWAAKELTRIEAQGDHVTLNAPFACRDFTLRMATRVQGEPSFSSGGERRPLRKAGGGLQLESGSWTRDGDSLVVCLDLPKGASSIDLAAG